MTSPIVRAAIERDTELRREFDDVRHAAYLAALEATRGHMLSPRGLRAGVDAFELFRCNTQTAMAYASAELVEWWITHPRMTYASYARQMEYGI